MILSAGERANAGRHPAGIGTRFRRRFGGPDPTWSGRLCERGAVLASLSLPERGRRRGVGGSRRPRSAARDVQDGDHSHPTSTPGSAQKLELSMGDSRNNPLYAVPGIQLVQTQNQVGFPVPPQSDSMPKRAGRSFQRFNSHRCLPSVVPLRRRIRLGARRRFPASKRRAAHGPTSSTTTASSVRTPIALSSILRSSALRQTPTEAHR